MTASGCLDDLLRAEMHIPRPLEGGSSATRSSSSDEQMNRRKQAVTSSSSNLQQRKQWRLREVLPSGLWVGGLTVGEMEKSIQ